MVNICPWCNTSGYILCAWDSGLAAREQADAPKGAVGDDLPALSGALVVRSLPPLYTTFPPIGRTTYKRGEGRYHLRGGRKSAAHSSFSSFELQASLSLSSRHHLVAVGRA